MWPGDGRELFYTAADGTLVAVEVTTQGRLRTGASTALFTASGRQLDTGNEAGAGDATNDGKLFLVRNTSKRQERIDVVTDALKPD